MVKKLSQTEIETLFGKTDAKGKNMVQMSLPYPMRLAWDVHTSVTKITCHKKLVNAYTNVFTQILAHYGLAKIQELGIDLYGGCFNYRLMRGSRTDLSTHSWGIAIDLDPARNQLKESSKTARFARKEYKPMLDIFEANGFYSLGRYKDYDWMHFQYGLTSV
jgi:hypothetical protein